MAKQERYVAVDLGAESGRVIAGLFDGDVIRTEEVHRFPTGGIRMLDRLVWDFPGFLREIRIGLAKFAAAYGSDPVSIGVDVWSDAFGLLDKGGRLLATPMHYRDDITLGVPEQLYARMPQETLYRHAGIHMMRHKMIYQMAGLALRDDPLLEAADTMLMGAELIYHFLSGETVGEYSDVTTTGLYDIGHDHWAWPVLDAARLPRRLFGEVVKPGTRRGTLLAADADECGLARVPMAYVCTHDTGSAVVGIPADQREDWLFISSGTWSLAGVELSAPVLTPEALAMTFTNEGGADGKVRFLKNIAGLWILQELRREWARQGRDYSYEQLTAMATAAKPFACVIDVDDARFLQPGDMMEKIAALCRETGQTPPADEGEAARSVLEGLALAYRKFVRDAEAMTGVKRSRIHIVGGGSKNALLNQLAADATGLPVRAGPVEATALGNIIVQAMASGALGSVWDGREIVRRTQQLQDFQPRAETAAQWLEAEKVYGH